MISASRLLVDSAMAGLVVGSARSAATSYFTSLDANSGEADESQIQSIGFAVDVVMGFATSFVMPYASSFLLSFLPEFDLVNENGVSFIPLGSFDRRGFIFVGANMVNNYAGGSITNYTGDALSSILEVGSAFISEFLGGHKFY